MSHPMGGPPIQSTPPTRIPRSMGYVGNEERDAPSLEYYPNHVTIQKLNDACTLGELDRLKALITAWKTDLQPPPGPLGYEIYTLEPVFYHAIEEGQGPIVGYFLDNGIRMCTLAIYKAIDDQVSTTVFQAFLDHGWDINDKPSGSRMQGLFAHPLGLLLNAGNDNKLVEWFLEHGADPNALYGDGRFGHTNFTWAVKHNSLSIIKLLHQYGGHPVSGILPWAIRDTGPEDIGLVEFLLDIGAPIDATEYEHDPWLQANYQAFNRGPAINRAVMSCSEDMVELLLSRGARTDVGDMNGSTCLDLAREYGFLRKEEIILSYIKKRGNSLQ